MENIANFHYFMYNILMNTNNHENESSMEYVPSAAPVHRFEDLMDVLRTNYKGIVNPTTIEGIHKEIADVLPHLQSDSRYFIGNFTKLRERLLNRWKPEIVTTVLREMGFEWVENTEGRFDAIYDYRHRKAYYFSPETSLSTSSTIEQHKAGKKQ